jgi:hypothetical protein
MFKQGAMYDRCKQTGESTVDREMPECELRRKTGGLLTSI